MQHALLELHQVREHSPRQHVALEDVGNLELLTGLSELVQEIIE